MSRKKKREGERHEMVKVPPARKAPQNVLFFSLSERTEKFSLVERLPRELMVVLIGHKNCHQESCQSKEIRHRFKTCKRRKLNFSVIGDPGTGEIILVFQCALRKGEYRKKYYFIVPEKI